MSSPELGIVDLGQELEICEIVTTDKRSVISVLRTWVG